MNDDIMNDDIMEQKRIAAIKSTEYIENNMILGLGTGSTAFFMTEKLGTLVKNGLNIKAVATSQSTEKVANQFDIPLISIDKVEKIDLAIDSVDEIDSKFNVIKGGNGAFFREKMVTDIADKVIWIMDSTKQVKSIGTFPLPVEVLPYGHTHILNTLKIASLNPVLRMKDGTPFVTDNNNYIIDLNIGKSFNIDYVSKKLKTISGVLETGLFLNTCDLIIVGTNKGADIMENPNKIKKSSGKGYFKKIFGRNS